MTDYQVIINSKVFKVIPYGYCACGCGNKTNLAKYSRKLKRQVKNFPMKFIVGHNGRLNHPKGYKKIKYLGHPKANCRGFVREHILIAEKALGKPLPDGVVIHHSNGTKTGPIVICENTAYHLLLHQRMRAFRSSGHANWKICHYCKRYDDPNNLKFYGKAGHHPSCQRKYARKIRIDMWKDKSPNNGQLLRMIEPIILTERDMMFKAGDRVKWLSQASGSGTIKKGIIVAIIPKNIYLQDTHFVRTTETPTGVLEDYKIMFDWPSLTRGHESYLVEVHPSGKATKNSAKPRLYWPRVSALIAV
jgi:hypothetical protein